MKYSSVIRLIKNYRWRSFFVRYFFITFIPFLLLFFIVSVTLFTNNLNNARKNEEEKAKRQLDGISYFMDNISREVLNSRHNIVIHEDVQYLFALKETGNLEFYRTIRSFQNYMGSFINGYDGIKSVYLYAMNSSFVLSSTSNFPSEKLDVFGDSEFYKNSENASVFVRKQPGGAFVITYLYPLYYGGKIDGCFAVNLDYDYIKETCLKNSDGESFIYISDDGGNILFTNDPNDIGGNEKDHFLSIGGKNEAYITFINNRIYAVREISDIGIKIILTSDFNNLSEYGAGFLNVALIIFILLISAVGISLLLTFKFYNSIFGMFEIIQGLGLTDSAKKDEINFINSSILSIIGKTASLEKELVERITMLNKSQALSLQSQLNPHFIFNTIHLINMLEMKRHKQETDVTVAIKLLGDILRVALDTTETFVSFEREIEYSEKYLQITSLKYKNKFTAKWLISEETKKLYILKLFLQPILENAVNHGFAGLKNNCEITVSSHIKGDNLFIVIKDNGLGMSREKLESVRTDMQDDSVERKAHLGLNNTNRRIKLIFGENYGCSISSDPNGTVVTVKIPVITAI